MRLFVGLFPPAAAVAHLDDALAAIRHGSGLRWQPAERWHVTLAFLGDVEPHRVDDVRADVAADCGSVPALTARLAGAGSFRTGRGGGALWIGVRGDGLAELAARLRSAELTDEEASRFRGHLTVARWRPPERLDDTVVRALGPYNGASWRPEEVVLVRSHLGPQPRYERIDQWPLSRAHDEGGGELPV